MSQYVDFTAPQIGKKIEKTELGGLQKKNPLCSGSWRFEQTRDDQASNGYCAAALAMAAGNWRDNILRPTVMSSRLGQRWPAGVEDGASRRELPVQDESLFYLASHAPNGVRRARSFCRDVHGLFVHSITPPPPTTPH